MLMTPEWVDRTRNCGARRGGVRRAPVGCQCSWFPRRGGTPYGFAVTRGILMACRRPQRCRAWKTFWLGLTPEAARAEAAAAGEIRSGEVGNMHDASRRRALRCSKIVDPHERWRYFPLGGGHGIDAVLVTPTCCDPLCIGARCAYRWLRVSGAVDAHWRKRARLARGGAERLGACGI